MKPFVSVLALCMVLGACAARAPQQDRVPLPAAPPPGEPASTEGMSAASLALAFGAPAFMRKDGGTELWRYDGATCQAFFFLYPEANGWWCAMSRPRRARWTRPPTRRVSTRCGTRRRRCRRTTCSIAFPARIARIASDPREGPGIASPLGLPSHHRYRGDARRVTRAFKAAPASSPGTCTDRARRRSGTAACARRRCSGRAGSASDARAAHIRRARA